jgi:hypothetical protein
VKRFHIALLAGLATLALGAIAVPVASANGTTVPNHIPALKTISIHGATKSGKQFNGTYAIQRFVAGANRVNAVGTLKGRLNGHRVALYNVKMPAALAKAPTNTAQAAAVCTVLNLTLGPIDLNLLGLRVQLFGGTSPNGLPPANPQPVTLLITADSNGGLLGQLLCGLTQNLGGTGILGQLSNNLNQLAATLNALTAILGAL